MILLLEKKIIISINSLNNPLFVDCQLILQIFYFPFAEFYNQKSDILILFRIIRKNFT